MISGLDISSTVPSLSREAQRFGEAIMLLNLDSVSGFPDITAGYIFTGLGSSKPLFVT
jgi:hypothetical protein